MQNTCCGRFEEKHAKQVSVHRTVVLGYFSAVPSELDAAFSATCKALNRGWWQEKIIDTTTYTTPCVTHYIGFRAKSHFTDVM
jgi:hypothetical protein